MVPVFNGEQEVSAEAILEIELAYASQRWTQVPIPVCEVGVRGPLGICDGFSDGELSFVNLSGRVRGVGG